MSPTRPLAPLLGRRGSGGRGVVWGRHGEGACVGGELGGVSAGAGGEPVDGSELEVAVCWPVGEQRPYRQPMLRAERGRRTSAPAKRPHPSSPFVPHPSRHAPRTPPPASLRQVGFMQRLPPTGQRTATSRSLPSTGSPPKSSPPTQAPSPCRPRRSPRPAEPRRPSSRAKGPPGGVHAALTKRPHPSSPFVDPRPSRHAPRTPPPASLRQVGFMQRLPPNDLALSGGRRPSAPARC
jgi:hypothetical protein